MTYVYRIIGVMTLGAIGWGIITLLINMWEKRGRG